MIEVTVKNYVFKLRKDDNGKFAHTAKQAGADGKVSKYLVAECTDPDATKAFGVQTRRIVRTIFEGSMVFEEMKNAIEAGIIDKETGESSKPLAGSFVDIDCGFTYEVDINGNKIKRNTVSVFIMAGEDFTVAKTRAVRAVERLRIQGRDDLESAESIKEDTKANEGQSSGSDDF
jgi:hypothetical protein